MEAQALSAFGSLALAPTSPESVRPAPRGQGASVERALGLVKPQEAEKTRDPQEDKDQDKNLTKGDLQNVAETLNGVMNDLRTNIKFAVHEKTKILMVQIVDARDQHVIKEIPPKEFLDMMAKLRDLAGAIFDRHA